jgi:Zn-finger nucleic acid-binding protein
MLCPKDNIVCDPILLQDVEVDVCPKCQGVWLDNGEVRRLVRHLSVPEFSSVDELFKAWEVSERQGTTPIDFWVEDKLTCPKEGAQMQKHYFAGSHIGVDHCLICKGFWLDGGELQAVARYVEPNPEHDALGRILIRLMPVGEYSSTQWADGVPVVLFALKNPVAGIILLGKFFVNLFFDRMRP